jgi:hypothetical protein
VLESHKQSDYPHLHIICDKHFPSKEFGPAAIHAGFGYQIREKRVDNINAALYIAKYLTKEWTNEKSWDFRKRYRCRLISFSRGLLSPKGRGESWTQLIVGTDFAGCLDHIRLDYTWDTARKGEISYENTENDFYEVTIVWTDRPEGSLERKDDDWEPDDWVPK